MKWLAVDDMLLSWIKATSTDLRHMLFQIIPITTSMESIGHLQ